LNHHSLWSSCLTIIQDNVPEASYSTWFKPVVPLKSNYNSRPFPPEILVSERRADCVRRRQPLERIWEGERAASWQARPASSRRRPR